MSRLLTVAAVLALNAACSRAIVLEVEISVPQALQATLTYPVQVAFESDVHTGHSQTLCAAESTDVVVFLDDTATGCAEPIEVRAALGAWTAPITGCTETDGNSYASVIEDAQATATTMAFESVDSSGGLCKGAHETVTMILEAAP